MEFFERPGAVDKFYGATIFMFAAMGALVASAGIIGIEETLLRWSRFLHFVRVMGM